MLIQYPVTCADPRSTPETFLQLQPGEGVLVVRNVCGHVAPVIPDILVFDAVVGLGDILVVHHIGISFDKRGRKHFLTRDRLWRHAFHRLCYQGRAQIRIS